MLSHADPVSTARFLSKVLPVARELGAIRTHVASMDPEVVGKHRAVRRIHAEIKSRNGRVEELSEHMAEVETAVTRLEPHIAYVNRAMRPLRRARARLPRSAAS
jgi:predicted  nucleic acid-binding Zn-ribbon protein